MPPKKGRGGARAGSRARGTPAPSSRRRDFDDEENSPEPTPTVRSRATPGPSKHSTSYGSPATQTMSRRLNYGSNLGSALSNVIQTVRDDNVRAEQLRAEREGRDELAGTPDPVQNSRASQARFNQDDELYLGLDEQTAKSMKPPPRPRRAQVSKQQTQDLSSKTQTDVGDIRDGSIRPTSTRPGTSSGGSSTGGSRQGSEPLIHSDALTARSFIEESLVYGSADLSTPKPPPSLSKEPELLKEVTNQQRKSPRQEVRQVVHEESPTSSPALIAADADAGATDNNTRGVNPTPTRKGTVGRPITRPMPPPPPMDEDDEDEEDKGDPFLPRDLPLDRSRYQSRVPLLERLKQKSSPQTASSNGVKPVAAAMHAPPALPQPPVSQSQGSSMRERQPRRNPLEDVQIDSAFKLPRPNPDFEVPQQRGQSRDDSEGSRTTGSSASGTPAHMRATPLDSSESRAQDAEAAHRHARQEQYNYPAMAASGAARTPDRPTGLSIIGRFLSFVRGPSSILHKIVVLVAWLLGLWWLGIILIGAFFPLSHWDGIASYPANVAQAPLNPGWAGILPLLFYKIPYVLSHPLAALGGLDYTQFRNNLFSLELRVHSLEIRMAHTTSATYEVRKLLPKLIKVEAVKGSGEFVIGDDFWYALRGVTYEDDTVLQLLTLQESRNGTLEISDKQWGAIKQRLDKEQRLLSDQPWADDNSPLALSDEVAALVKNTMSKSWETWLRDNHEAVRKIMLQDVARNPYFERLYGELEKMVEEKLSARGLEEQLVTREQFIEQMRRQFAENRHEIQSEMQVLHDKLGQAMGMALEAKNAAHSPQGLTRSEIDELVDQSVRRAIGEAQLEAMAKGHIKSHLNNELSMQKNYFGAGSGAIVDPTFSTNTYDSRPKYARERQSLFKHIFKSSNPATVVNHPIDPQPPIEALKKWEEEGDCWCSNLVNAKNMTGPAQLSIMTAEPLIPQHLVVEHINPGASFDPDAMPRDLEVWIMVENHRRLESLRHWSERRWQSSKHDRLYQKGFTKVGEATYDRAIGKSEAQVFKLPDELVRFDSQTTRVLIRATTNYGADHTCFYRVRLFGEEVKDKRHNSSL